LEFGNKLVFHGLESLWILFFPLPTFFRTSKSPPPPDGGYPNQPHSVMLATIVNQLQNEIGRIDGMFIPRLAGVAPNGAA